MILQEHEPDLIVEPRMTPVAEFGEDKARNDQVFGGLDDERSASRMVWIVGVEGRQPAARRRGSGPA